jgi:hypothetical protein
LTPDGAGEVTVEVGGGEAGGGEAGGISAIGGGEALGVSVDCCAVGVAAGLSRLQARVKTASTIINIPEDKPAGGQQLLKQK